MELLNEHPKIELHLDDCLNVMKDIPDKSIDLVLTDPPYGINVIGGSKPFGSIGGSKLCQVRQYQSIRNDDIKIDLTELFRISKEQIIFGGNYFNLPISKGWIVWDKKCKNNWNDNFSDGELAWTSFNKPLRIFRHLQMGLLQEGKKEEKFHPTQKPIELIKYILKNYSNPKDTVLDPFMGSGTTGVACVNMGCNFFGVEIEEKYYNVAKKRIEQELSQGSLF